MDLQQRLAEFFRRLAAAPPAASAEEALALVCRLIEEVEDELCPFPRGHPAPTDLTGRMYAPQSDNVRPASHGGIYAVTRRHLIFCGTDGRIVIEHIQRKLIVLTKSGKK